MKLKVDVARWEGRQVASPFFHSRNGPLTSLDGLGGREVGGGKAGGGGVSGAASGDDDRRRKSFPPLKHPENMT